MCDPATWRCQLGSEMKWLYPTDCFLQIQSNRSRHRTPYRRRYKAFIYPVLGCLIFLSPFNPRRARRCCCFRRRRHDQNISFYLCHSGSRALVVVSMFHFLWQKHRHYLPLSTGSDPSAGGQSRSRRFWTLAFICTAAISISLNVIFVCTRIRLNYQSLDNFQPL